MVRIPLSAEQIEAGRRLGAVLRAARGGRDPEEVSRRAGISPETLRKIEVGRIASPGFGTVVQICDALDVAVQDVVDAWVGAHEGQIAI